MEAMFAFFASIASLCVVATVYRAEVLDGWRVKAQVARTCWTQRSASRGKQLPQQLD